MSSKPGIQPKGGLNIANEKGWTGHHDTEALLKVLESLVADKKVSSDDIFDRIDKIAKANSVYEAKL